MVSFEFNNFQLLAFAHGYESVEANDIQFFIVLYLVHKGHFKGRNVLCVNRNGGH